MLTRRRFLQLSGAAGTALAFDGLTGCARRVPVRRERSLDKIEHVVLVMMENRSFDHFLGWLPGANGRQAGLTFADCHGKPSQTHPLAPDYRGCSHPDPDHSYEGGRVEYADGKCDGWLRAGKNDAYSIGYYVQADLGFLGRAAVDWTTCDAYHAPIMAETFPNRIYQHCAATDRVDNSLAQCTLPTIWDHLEARGVSHRYYYTDVPVLALWRNLDYVPFTKPFAAFEADCAGGTLPAVSFVDPRFIYEANGTSIDDHPHADVRAGEVFLNRVYRLVTTSPAWPRTVMVINFDEWGGFFDHAVPDRVPKTQLGSWEQEHTDGLRGFRVPCVVVSPFARRGFVAHGTYDHVSVLRMIEERWHLEPLGHRDAAATNIADVLDLEGTPNVDAPTYPVPERRFGRLCRRVLPSDREDANKWYALRAIAARTGML